jgi:hypothetical protein
MGELAGATGAAPKYKFTPSGAPRPMKMGTIVSPWRYDAAARRALKSVNLRRPTILRCAASCLPDFAGWSRYPLGIETRGAVLPTVGR